MRNITFSKDGDGKYISEITITAPAVLHLERDKGGAFYYEKSHLSNGNYSPVNYSEIEYLESAKTIDLVLQDAIYPLYIKVTSTSKPTSAVIGNPSNVICTDETNAELMNVARSQGWVDSDATEMTEGEAFAVTRLPTSSSVWGNCTSLNELEYFDNVTKVEDNTFYDCTALTSVIIPNNVTSIGDFAFQRCKALTEISLTSSLTSIGNSAFLGCTALKSITIPDNVTSLGSKAFTECTAMTYVTIGKGITIVGYGTFEGCTSLASVTLGESVSNIGENAFYKCKKLWYIKLKSDKLTSIGADAFANTAITNINFISSCNIEEIGSYAFASCAQLSNVSIPKSVKIIGNCAFSGCTALSYVDLYNVTNIKAGAFQYCSTLTFISIKTSVTNIGSDAFADCTALASVYCNPTTPPTLGSTAFANNASTRKIYVPSASVDAYKGATNWSAYADYIVAQS